MHRRRRRAGGPDHRSLSRGWLPFRPHSRTGRKGRLSCEASQHRPNQRDRPLFLIPQEESQLQRELQRARMMSEMDAENIRALQAQLDAQKATIESLKKQQGALAPQLDAARSDAAAKAATAAQLARELQQKEARFGAPCASALRRFPPHTLTARITVGAVASFLPSRSLLTPRRPALEPLFHRLSWRLPARRSAASAPRQRPARRR